MVLPYRMITSKGSSRFLARNDEESSFDAIHEPAWHVGVRSCGRINAILESLIEIGVDVLNLQQPLIYGTDITSTDLEDSSQFGVNTSLAKAWVVRAFLETDEAFVPPEEIDFWLYPGRGDKANAQSQSNRQ